MRTPTNINDEELPILDGAAELQLSGFAIGDRRYFGLEITHDGVGSQRIGGTLLGLGPIPPAPAPLPLPLPASFTLETDPLDSARPTASWSLDGTAAEIDEVTIGLWLPSRRWYLTLPPDSDELRVPELPDEFGVSPDLLVFREVFVSDISDRDWDDARLGLEVGDLGFGALRVSRDSVSFTPGP